MARRDIDDLLSQYRAIDTGLGTLETLTRLRYEVLKLREAQVRTRLTATETPLAVALIALLAGVPALYSVMPDSWQSSLWPIVLVLLLLIVIARLAFAVYGAHTDRDAINELLPAEDGARRLEHRAWFKQMQASAYGTRLSLAKQTLESSELTDKERNKFERAAEWWSCRLKDLADDTERLQNIGHFSKSEADSIRNWIEAGLDQ